MSDVVGGRCRGRRRCPSVGTSLTQLTGVSSRTLEARWPQSSSPRALLGRISATPSGVVKSRRLENAVGPVP
jgi:hypothetical protein